MSADSTDRQDATSRAPLDPRLSWDEELLHPRPGASVCGPGVTRVLARNASAMTLDGTNSYIVGDANSDVVIVDPGPLEATHLEALEVAVRDLDATVVAVIATHHHLDHAEAASLVAKAYGVSVWCGEPSLLPEATVAERVEEGPLRLSSALTLEVVPTPGHTRDSISLVTAAGEVLTGDQLLGRGTSVIMHPQGDVKDHLRSVDVLRRLAPGALHPGHGPSLGTDIDEILEYYKKHRRYRRLQVLEQLAAGPATLLDIVNAIYPGITDSLMPAAAATTHAMLAYLHANEDATYDAGADLWKRTPWSD